MIIMSIDPEKIGPKTSDPLFFIKPLTPDEKKKMQESLREADKTLGIHDKRKKFQKVSERISKEKEISPEDKESDEDKESNENKLANSGKEKEVGSGKRWVNIKFLIGYAKYAESTLREHVRLGTIPFHRRKGSRLIHFDLDEIDKWLAGEWQNEKAVDK